MKELAQHIRSKIKISSNELEFILTKFTKIDYEKKSYLLTVDDKLNSTFFITSGCVRTYLTDYNGVEHTISFAIENWWAGDLQSFINQIPSVFYIQAIEDTTVLAINRADWQILIDELPIFSKYSMLLFRNAVIAQQDRIVQNLSFTAKERYLHFLKHHSVTAQRVTQKHIASYLGITPEFLSMLRKKL